MTKRSRQARSESVTTLPTRVESDSSDKAIRKRRCAVYTRKSSEEGLDMEFNSLDAQRESCEAYIKSQRQEGWLLVGDRYDDGGWSGGNMERPALKRLLKDIQAGRVDVVVVYKIDRLSRSMADFLKMVEIFDQHGVTFISITQSFNTTTSMGRLTLNMLLSFAQFERENTGERIRDKVAASRRKGIWMGGWAPFGYVVKDRKLVIEEKDADRVRAIFRRFIQLRSTTLLARELIQENATNRYGHKLDKGVLYRVLVNRTYLGEAVHKGVSYPGEHKPIIDQALWDKAHAIMRENPRKRASNVRAQTPALLKGLLFGRDGEPMTPTHTRKGGKLYRYYLTQNDLKRGQEKPLRVPAGEIERVVVDQMRGLLQTPEIIVQTWRAARKTSEDITEAQVRKALLAFDDLWDELFPAEQTNIARLLVERVQIGDDDVEIRLRTEGLTLLHDQLTAAQPKRKKAA